MAFKVEEEVWEVLFHEPPELFKLYCAIRCKMDFKTGIAGKKAGLKISENYLREVLSIDSKPGRHKDKTGKASRQKMRVALRHLEKLGIITHQGHLVFLCNFASMDNSVQKRRNQGGTRRGTTGGTIGGTKKNRCKPLQNLDNLKYEEPNEEPQEDAEEIEMRNPPPDPVLNNNKSKALLLFSKSEKNSEKRFKFKISQPLPNDFAVTTHHDAYAAEQNLPSPHSEIEKFKNHALTNNRKCNDWDGAFRNWLIKAKEIQEKYNERYQNAHSKPKNSIERARALNTLAYVDIAGLDPDEKI